MKLIRTLHITSDEFYDYLEEQLTLDIEKATSRKVRKIETGLRYSQHGDNQFAKIDFRITKYERGHCYELVMKSYTDSTIIHYDTCETEDGLKVVFEETINDGKKRNKLSQKFTEALCLSQRSRTIYDIETAIINKRQQSI